MKTTSHNTAQFARVKTTLAVVNEKDSANETARNTIIHHLGALQDNDLDAVVSDYSSEAVLITPFAVFTGLEEIKTFFTDLIMHFPKHKSRFELDKLIVNQDVVYIIWHANTPSLEVSLGSDTYVLKDGKIHRQTFVGDLNYING